MSRSPELLVMPVTEDLVRGALDVEKTSRGLLPHRLPSRARRLADGQLAMAESQPSGVRLAFRTRATFIELTTVPTKQKYLGAPRRPDGVYDLLVNGRLAAQAIGMGGNTLTIDMQTGAATHEPGEPATLTFSGLSSEQKDVEIWLPWNETTELVSLQTDAPVERMPSRGARVWLHHGSSISHGSNAASPSTTWPAIAASLGGVELINLGFGGGALLDPFTARVIKETAADVISIKIGINIVNYDLMRLRAFAPAVHGFLDTIRDGHPTTPLLLISSLFCPIHEDTPGPCAPDMEGLAEGRMRFRATGDPADTATGKLSLNVIRQELERVVQQRSEDDPHLGYLDGRDLYGEPDALDLPLPDELHPDAATHLLIGQRFASASFGAGGFLAPPGDGRSAES